MTYPDSNTVEVTHPQLLPGRVVSVVAEQLPALRACGWVPYTPPSDQADAEQTAEPVAEPSPDPALPAPTGAKSRARKEQ